jgi:hypothetical protein
MLNTGEKKEVLNLAVCYIFIGNNGIISSHKLSMMIKSYVKSVYVL